MGTNYYFVADPCPHCGRNGERLHIGKSSGGWCFALHIDQDNGINDLPDWQARWSAGKIEDEYGHAQTTEEMFDIVTERSINPEDWNGRKWYGYESELHFHRSNLSERGPRGLLRRRIDGKRCIGHGNGTWDLVVGEFS